MSINSTVPGAGESAKPVHVGGYRQLFLDDHVVAERMNVRRECNPVKKADFNPIITCDTPWEPEGDGYYIERMSIVNDKDRPAQRLLAAWRTL